jgi:hypothetical protein
MFFAFWINSLRNCCLCEREDLSQRDNTPLSSASERTGAMPLTFTEKKSTETMENYRITPGNVCQEERKGRGIQIPVVSPLPDPRPYLPG